MAIFNGYLEASPLVRKGQRLSWEMDRPTERLPKLLLRPASSPARPRPSRMEERRTQEGLEGKFHAVGSCPGLGTRRIVSCAGSFDAWGAWRWHGLTSPVWLQRIIGCGVRPPPSC
eukprot:s1836_g17.t1